MTSVIRLREWFLATLLLLPLFSFGKSTNEVLARATAAVKAAVPRAEADPNRPLFHVAAPAQWMNDPNGPIFHKGFYHLFYQLHPFSDEGGPKYWGHIRSRDLAKWEHLPIALAPSPELGENEIWSGCCTVNGKGKPMIFYTSIARDKSAMDHAEQWAATSDDDLIDWQKLPANPVMTEALHGETKIYDWRDPFIFRDKNRTFMVLGGNLNKGQGGQAVVNIYEAGNDELTKWKYRGVLFQHPDASARSAECPNFFKLGQEWVLFVSPYGEVQYFIGDFNAETGRFQPRTRGVVDHSRNFYAPNTMQVSDGRRIVWGWIVGFPGGHGWNGCLSLPRMLSVSRDGQLLQNPAPQLERLRGKRVEWKNVQLENGRKVFPLPKTNTLEIFAEIDLKTAQGIELGLKGGTGDAQNIVVNFNGSELKVMDIKAPLLLADRERKLTLRIFIDRSVLEVFANGTVCMTKVISPMDSGASLEIRAVEGLVNLKKVQAWPMKTIW